MVTEFCEEIKIFFQNCQCDNLIKKLFVALITLVSLFLQKYANSLTNKMFEMEVLI